MNRINYLIIPIDLIYQIKEKYRIIDGGQYGTLLSSDFPVKANDFGIFAGFGQIIDNTFFFNIKFYNGLTNISKSNSENHVNQYLNIGIGYYFN